MYANVPQDINVEDKVAGPLTWRQLLWMIGMGAILLVLYNSVSLLTFLVAGTPIAIIFLAFAFYRPHGQPLIRMTLWGIGFLFRPKVYTWQRLSQPSRSNVLPNKKSAPKTETVQIPSTEIEHLADILDNPEKNLTEQKNNATIIVTKREK